MMLVSDGVPKGIRTPVPAVKGRCLQTAAVALAFTVSVRAVLLTAFFALLRRAAE